MKSFFQSLRLPFAAVTVSSVLLGTAAVFRKTGSVNIETLLIVIFVLVFAHISANLFNDYFDHRFGNDERNEHPTPLNGGSRVIQEKKLLPQTVLVFASVFAFLSVALGMFFVWQQQNIFLAIFGAAGLFLGFAYTAPPFKLVYRGFGETIVALAFGPFTVGGAYLAQTGTIPEIAWILSIPAGFLTAAILLTNSIPDESADKLSEKRTYVVRKGADKTILFCKDLVIVSYATIVSAIILGILPIGAFTSFLSLGFALKYFQNLNRVKKDFLPAGEMAIALHILFVLLTAIGIAFL